MAIAASHVRRAGPAVVRLCGSPDAGALAQMAAVAPAEPAEVADAFQRTLLLTTRTVRHAGHAMWAICVRTCTASGRLADFGACDGGDDDYHDLA